MHLHMSPRHVVGYNVALSICIQKIRLVIFSATGWAFLLLLRTEADAFPYWQLCSHGLLDTIICKSSLELRASADGARASL